MTALLVGLAAALGALMRFLVDRAVAARTQEGLPMGTLSVNVSGSLALGVLVGSAPSHAVLTLAGTGFLGAYTTFSALAVEMLRLAEDGAGAHAVVYAAGSLLAGLVAAAAGLLIGAALQ